jgi:multiple sugar transport system ATP-binding protein
MGRAIVRNPQVFLMDEPLSNLDAKLRVKMRVDIAGLQRELGVTMLYVTHDQVEAMTMGQRVAVLSEGRLQQCGPPHELYNRPANLFVAGFIGSPAMNLIPAPLNADGCALMDGVAIALPRETASLAAGRGVREVVLGLRPESIELGDSEGLPARVEVVEELGADAYAFCVATLGQVETKLIARTDPRRAPARGEQVTLAPRVGEAHVFDPTSGERLGR